MQNFPLHPRYVPTLFHMELDKHLFKIFLKVNSKQSLCKQDDRVIMNLTLLVVFLDEQITVFSDELLSNRLQLCAHLLRLIQTGL